jgi:hypothetical protein
MKSLDDRLLEGSRSIMDRAAVLLQKVNPNFVAAATMLACSGASMLAMADQIDAMDALKAADPEAFKAMFQAMPQTMTGWVKACLNDTHPIPGVAELGKQLMFNLTAPVAAGFTASIAQKFGNMKAEIESLRSENQSLSHGMPEVNARTVKEVLQKSGDGPRGATRLSETLTQGLRGLDEGIKPAEQSSQIRGPRA